MRDKARCLASGDVAALAFLWPLQSYVWMIMYRDDVPGRHVSCRCRRSQAATLLNITEYYSIWSKTVLA